MAEAKKPCGCIDKETKGELICINCIRYGDSPEIDTYSPLSLGRKFVPKHGEY